MIKTRREGFTLIELLIVIAILGTLAVVVLLALNPLQQLARTRDAGRSSTVAQLGHAVEAYATVHNGQYPSNAGSTNCTSGGWIQNCLVTTGEIQTVPDSIANSSCAGGSANENNICYMSAGGTTPWAKIWTAAEAKANTSRCNGSTAACPTSAVASFVYATSEGRGGLVCAATPPNTATQTFCE